MIVVSDASPIIALSAVGKLSLLRQLYERVLIPESVAREIFAGESGQPGIEELRSADWIAVQSLENSFLARAFEGELDKGEAEAIALAAEIRADLLLADERRARKVAGRLGIHVVGVLGVLVEAKQNGLLPTVGPVLDDLRERAGFRISSALYRLVVQTAGERLGEEDE